MTNRTTNKLLKFTKLVEKKQKEIEDKINNSAEFKENNCEIKFVNQPEPLKNKNVLIWDLDRYYLEEYIKLAVEGMLEEINNNMVTPTTGDDKFIRRILLVEIIHKWLDVGVKE